MVYYLFSMKGGDINDATTHCCLENISGITKADNVKDNRMRRPHCEAVRLCEDFDINR